MSKKYESSWTPYLIIGFIAILVFVVIGFLAFKNSNPSSFPSSSSKTNREVALTCTTNMATKFHIHSILKIVINGENQKVPANIGVEPNCMMSLHTHDGDGTIHVESPEKRDFTLDDFFAVWQKTFNKDQILGFGVDDEYIIRQTINGEESNEFENTILKDGDEIIIYFEKKK